MRRSTTEMQMSELKQTTINPAQVHAHRAETQQCTAPRLYPNSTANVIPRAAPHSYPTACEHTQPCSATKEPYQLL